MMMKKTRGDWKRLRASVIASGDTAQARKIIEQMQSDIETLYTLLDHEDWQTMECAPQDGSPVHGFGVHAINPPASAGRGVKPGDGWLAIMLFDVWRDPHQWVFAKDGESLWSHPVCWRPLLWPTPKVLVKLGRADVLHAMGVRGNADDR